MDLIKSEENKMNEIEELSDEEDETSTILDMTAARRSTKIISSS